MAVEKSSAETVIRLICGFNGGPGLAIGTNQAREWVIVDIELWANIITTSVGDEESSLWSDSLTVNHNQL